MKTNFRHLLLAIFMIFAACEQDELIVPEQQPEQSKQQLVNPDFPMLQYSSRDAL